MISVLNRLQPLSGNKIFIMLGIVFLAACSPKTLPENRTPVTPAPDRPVKDRPIPVEKRETVEKEVKPEMIISLVLPFDLTAVNYKTAGTRDIAKAELAIDYYQGFKMALDSVANHADTHFKLQVYDSKDDPANIAILAAKAGIKNSDLIVGPVFPNGITAFATYSKSMKKPTISPLAATDPATFNNPYLVSVNNSLDQHVNKALSFIKSDLKPKKIVLIRSGQADEYKYAVPFKKNLDSLAKGIAFTEIGIKAVGYENVYKSLNPIGLNVIVLPATDRNFLLSITKEVRKLTSNFKIAVIGHPGWDKLQFLDGAIMEQLNAHITSSYKIDYKTARTERFIQNYRANFNLEPGEFAFKGFDTGYYFAKLMEKEGKAFESGITKESYDGLHNSFRFIKDKKIGYYNNSLMVLKYEGFQLIKVN